MSIAEYMKELKEIVAELKNLGKRGKELRNRKKELENIISEYLDDSDTPGLKYKELIVVKYESKTRSKKKKVEKQESLINVLQNLGISDTKKASEMIQTALNGELNTTTKLKVKQTLPEITE
jgi:hypothetical protein